MATEDSVNLGAEDLSEDEFGEESSGRSRKKIGLALVLLAILASGGLVAGLYFSGGLGILLDRGGERAASDPDAAQTVQIGDLYRVDEIIVNVTGTSGGGRMVSRFLKISVTIVHDPATAARLEQREDFIRDAYQTYLRQLTQDDVEGMLGLVKLKAELLRRTRSIIGEDEVKDVLVTELLIQ